MLLSDFPCLHAEPLVMAARLQTIAAPRVALPTQSPGSNDMDFHSSCKVVTASASLWMPHHFLYFPLTLYITFPSMFLHLTVWG